MAVCTLGQQYNHQPSKWGRICA